MLMEMYVVRSGVLGRSIEVVMSKFFRIIIMNF